MRKFLSILLILLIVVIARTGWRIIGEEYQEDDEWEEVTSYQGRFTVLMPRGARETVQTINSSTGPMEQHILMWQSDSRAYTVMYMDYPQMVVDVIDSRELLDMARDGGADAIQGRVLSEVLIELDGYPGRHARILGPDGDMVFSVHSYLRGRRLYTVIAGARKDQIFDAYVQRFHESFAFF